MGHSHALSEPVAIEKSVQPNLLIMQVSVPIRRTKLKGQNGRKLKETQSMLTTP